MKILGKTKQVKAQVSFHGFSSNVVPDGISLVIDDASSGTRVLELTLSYEAAGQMISGHGQVECEMDIWDAFERVGKVHEHKTEQIEVPTRGSLTELKNEVTRYETDGWVADIPTTWNSHKWDNKNGLYTVSFRRYVDPETITHDDLDD